MCVSILYWCFFVAYFSLYNTHFKGRHKTSKNCGAHGSTIGSPLVQFPAYFRAASLLWCLNLLCLSLSLHPPAKVSHLLFPLSGPLLLQPSIPLLFSFHLPQVYWKSSEVIHPWVCYSQAIQGTALLSGQLQAQTDVAKEVSHVGQSMVLIRKTWGGEVPFWASHTQRGYGQFPLSLLRDHFSLWVLGRF